MSENHNNILPKGTLLKNRYRILGCAGTDEWEILYIAKDEYHNEKIFVFELFHARNCERDSEFRVQPVEDNGIHFQEYVQCYLEELNALRAVNHQSVAQIMDCFKSNNTVYGCIKEVEDGDYLHSFVNSFLQTEQAPEKKRYTALKLMCSIIDVLTAIHRENNGYYYGSLLNSALVNASGEIMLLPSPFKLKLLSISHKDPDPELWPYQEPIPRELLEKGAETGAYTDMYFLGVLIYALLSGKSHTVSNPGSWPTDWHADKMPVPADFELGINNELSKVLMKIWEDEPRNRFQSFDELKLALSNCTLPWGTRTSLSSKTKIMGMYEALPADTILKDRYRIEAVAGSGGFSVIYKATDMHRLCEVCIKEFFLNGEMNRDHNGAVHPEKTALVDFDVLWDLFYKEYSIMKGLNSSFTPEVFDFFQENNTAYMVMEFLPGESLHDAMLKNDRYSIKDGMSKFYQILGIVEQLHNESTPVIHCDIKPRNILFRDGLPVLIDFFQSLHLHELKEPNTQPIICTPGFTPPELYDEGKCISPATDVYSLGATLYAMLTGKTPICASRRPNEPLIYPHELNPAIDVFISGIIVKAMAIDPKDRYADVKSLRQDVFKYMSPEKPESNEAMLLRAFQQKMANLMDNYATSLQADIRAFQINTILDDLYYMFPAYDPQRLAIKESVNEAIYHPLRTSGDVQMAAGHLDKAARWYHAALEWKPDCKYCEAQLAEIKYQELRQAIDSHIVSTRFVGSPPTGLQFFKERIMIVENVELRLELESLLLQFYYDIYRQNGGYYYELDNFEAAEDNFRLALEYKNSCNYCTVRLQELIKRRKGLEKTESPN